MVRLFSMVALLHACGQSFVGKNCLTADITEASIRAIVVRKNEPNTLSGLFQTVSTLVGVLVMPSRDLSLGAEAKLTPPDAVVSKQAQHAERLKSRQRRLRGTRPSTISIILIPVHTFSPVRERDVGDYRILPT
ncbi:hypothetical protein J6590_106326 [Homalodisca vitripennis]|nr:hypothetical protein J6590_106326 [Homalodisca vitripennis]